MGLGGLSVSTEHPSGVDHHRHRQEQKEFRRKAFWNAPRPSNQNVGSLRLRVLLGPYVVQES